VDITHLSINRTEGTVIYLVNNKTYIGNNIENSVTCFGSVEPSSGQIQNTVLVHSASAYVFNVPVLNLVFGLMMAELNRNMLPNFQYYYQ
jgi:hypothetical protein